MRNVFQTKFTRFLKLDYNLQLKLYYNFYFLFVKFVMLITYVIINITSLISVFKNKLLHS